MSEYTMTHKTQLQRDAMQIVAEALDAIPPAQQRRFVLWLAGLLANQQEEIERLRKALTIYADDENWIQGAGVADWIHDDDPQRIAQKALEVR